jgi:hypothetical protein
MKSSLQRLSVLYHIFADQEKVLNSVRNPENAQRANYNNKASLHLGDSLQACRSIAEIPPSGGGAAGIFNISPRNCDTRH